MSFAAEGSRRRRRAVVSSKRLGAAVGRALEPLESRLFFNLAPLAPATRIRMVVSFACVTSPAFGGSIPLTRRDEGT